MRYLCLCVGVCALIVVSSVSQGGTVHRHPHRHHHAMRVQHRRVDNPYRAGGYRDPTPTCRYPDGTPYDPDIIGGPNHVGDGGPAVNLGGFDPCGY